RFDKERDRFDVSCRERLVRLAVPRDSGIYIAPPPKPEQLVSNLLEVITYPRKIYVAATDFRKAARSPRQSGSRIRTPAASGSCAASSCSASTTCPSCRGRRSATPAASSASTPKSGRWPTTSYASGSSPSSCTPAYHSERSATCATSAARSSSTPG